MRCALAKIAAVLPTARSHELDTSTLLVSSGAPLAAGTAQETTIRHAIHAETKLNIRYRDAGARTACRPSGLLRPVAFLRYNP